MIKLQNVNKYFGDHHVLKDINLEVAEGEKIVIIGPSGSGKSTTVRCMNFLEEPTSGEVFIEGKQVTAKKQIRSCTQFFCNGFSTVQPLSAYDGVGKSDDWSNKAAKKI